MSRVGTVITYRVGVSGSSPALWENNLTGINLDTLTHNIHITHT